VDYLDFEVTILPGHSRHSEMTAGAPEADRHPADVAPASDNPDLHDASPMTASTGLIHTEASIEPGEERLFSVRINSPEGEQSTEAPFPFDREELAARLHDVEGALWGSSAM
jgi:hypothetical protein